MSGGENPGVRAWTRGAARPFILGHRGARRVAPENTLESFARALKDGADGVELDVRLTRDQELVVFHDRTLTRMTDGRVTSAVEELSLRELLNVELAGGARVPSLAEALAWAEATGARINIEIKQDVRSLRTLVREVVRLGRAMADAPERLLFSSFHPGAVWELRRALPEFAVGWLVHDGQRLLRGAPGLPYLAPFVHPELVLATPKRLARWKARGARVAVWTVNDADDARRLAAEGVDVLISDTPELLAKAWP